MPIYLPGTRVSAKYRGNGVVIVPSDDTTREPHFGDDVAVRWDSGMVTWVQPSSLTLERFSEL